MSQSSSFDPILGSISRRLNRAVWLERAVPLLAAVIAGFGVLMLLLKMVAPQWVPFSVAVFAPLPLLLFYAYLACRKKNCFFNESEVAEVVDHLSGSDGQVTAAYERPALVPDTRFYETVQQRLREHLPRLDAAYYARRLGPAVLFSAAVLVIPPRPPSGEKGSQEMLAAVTQPLAEKLQMSAEMLPEEEKEELEKALEEVQKNPDGVSKEQWEAVEEMEQRLEDAMQQTEAAAGQMASALNELAGMMGEQSGDSSPLGDDAEKKQRMEQIIQDLELRSQNPKMPLSKEQRKKMREMMGKCKNGKCDKAELEKLRKELQGLCEKMGKCNGSDAGRGGVNRGRGDAALVLGEEKTIDAAFQEKEVANQFIAPEDMVDLGVIPVEPKPDPGRFSPSTVKNFGEQQGSNVNRTRISPSQKDVVSRYFAK